MRCCRDVVIVETSGIFNEFHRQHIRSVDHDGCFFIGVHGDSVLLTDGFEQKNVG